MTSATKFMMGFVGGLFLICVPIVFIASPSWASALLVLAVAIGIFLGVKNASES